jgi:hypothetical protein
MNNFFKTMNFDNTFFKSVYFTNIASLLCTYASYHVAFVSFTENDEFIYKFIQTCMITHFSSLAALMSNSNHAVVKTSYVLSIVSFYSTMTYILYHPEMQSLKDAPDFQWITQLYKESIHGMLYYSYFALCKYNLVEFMKLSKSD